MTTSSSSVATEHAPSPDVDIIDDQIDDQAVFEVLRLVARTTLTEAQETRLLQIGREAPPWVEIAQRASYHGILPLLYTHLRTLDRNHPDLLEDGLLQWIRRPVNTWSVHSMVITNETAHVLGALEAAGVDALTVKGAPLALHAYGSVALRSFADLDLIIHRRDFRTTDRALRDLGYTRPDLNRLQQSLYLSLHGQYPYTGAVDMGGKKTPVFLDLHTRAFPLGYRFRSPLKEMLKRTRSVKGLPDQLRAPGPADLVILLCYHGFKSRWDRLKYLTDLNEVIRAEAELSWHHVDYQAERVGGQRIVHLGLYLAHRLLDADLPRWLVTEIEADLHVTALAETVMDHLPRQVAETPDAYWDRVSFNLRGQDTLRGRLRYASYSILRHLSDFVIPKHP